MIYTIFDIETNGLRKGGVSPEVLEVGYIQVNSKVTILRHGSFYFYRPEWTLQQEAAKVHGLTREFLEKYEDEYTDSLVKLWTLMQKGNLVGKNSDAFDIPICRDMFRGAAYSLGVPYEDRSIDMQKVWSPKYKKLVKEHTGKDVKNPGTLEEYVNLIGWEEEDLEGTFNTLFPDSTERCGKHGALFDAFMTLIVVRDAVKDGMLSLEAG